jgi:hypothetical protein
LFFSDTLVNLMPGNCQKAKQSETKREEKQPSNNQKERRSLSSTSTGGEAVLCD